ncbi:MAG: iron ABC transporter permease [Bacteroidales bacterium]|jgi:iron complex transport system permease protein|nr:iron ABC transporter permease [Bacteroidales bacterium]MDD2570313.1 iron ABC transporter permease [Bacteroidales bacterium]MDD2812658.1 iron ABC transporter permease [Bacteroidales bacterium]MDD3384927.1 iron ABC transporter permease [Bacteroidales bacterium]MDD3811218.1 iron ABC transporter permease [Bacteroidales bacterium]
MNHLKRHSILFISLGLLTLAALLADLMFGSVSFTWEDLGQVLSGSQETENLAFILWKIRLPKALTGILVGAGLSVSGLMMQTLFRNPLAGPYVLGISSGASLGVAILMMASSLFTAGATSGILLVGHWGMVLAAMFGALLVMLLVILVSMRIADSVSILIIGIMFGSAAGALVSVLQYFSDPDSVHSFLVWTFGSIAGVSWSQLGILVPLVIAGLFAAVVLQKPLNAFLLGENQARALGVNVKRIRLLVVILTSLLTGALTAFTGPIAFVGIAVPHLARMLFRTSDHRLIIPASVLIGSLLLLVCDILTQVPTGGQVLPINSVTALFGAPVVIWVIMSNRKTRNAWKS